MSIYILPIHYTKNFTTKHPNAIQQYSAKIKQLPATKQKEHLLAYIAEYIDQALNSNVQFKAWRMQTENNPHLDKIFTCRPDLKEAWQKQTAYSLEKYQNSDSTDALDIREFFRNKIVVDAHIHLEEVIAFLLAGRKDNNPNKNNLQIVSSLVIECMEDAFSSLDIAAKKKHIQRIIQHLDVNQHRNFIRDLEQLMGLMEPFELTFSKYTIGMTHDPIDVLLCGT